jgi:hypothetical protein
MLSYAERVYYDHILIITYHSKGWTVPLKIGVTKSSMKSYYDCDDTVPGVLYDCNDAVTKYEDCEDYVWSLILFYFSEPAVIAKSNIILDVKPVS